MISPPEIQFAAPGFRTAEWVLPTELRPRARVSGEAARHGAGLLALAHHAAGQCVAAVVHGNRIRRVRCSTPAGPGQVRGGMEPEGPVSLATLVAGTIAAGRAVPQVEAPLDVRLPAVSAADSAAAVRIAAGIIDAEFDAARAVAEALFNRETLAGPDAERVVRSALRGRPSAQAAAPAAAHPQAQDHRPRPTVPFREAWERSDPVAQAAARRMAIHEAGHAVANVIEGAGVRSVRLVYEVDRAGRLASVGGECGARFPKRTSLFSDCAGLAAEMTAGYGEPASWDDSSDARSARLRCAAEGPPDADRAITGAVSDGCGRLRASWPAVVRVAAALLQDGELSGPRAELMVLAALEPAVRDAAAARLELL